MSLVQVQAGAPGFVSMKTLSFFKTVGVTALITLIIVNTAKTSWEIYKKGERLTKLEAEVARLQQQKAELEKLSQIVDTPAYIEQAARDKLHMVYQGERIVVLPAEPGVRQDLGSLLGASAEATTHGPIWKQWLDLIFS